MLPAIIEVKLDENKFNSAYQVETYRNCSTPNHHRAHTKCFLLYNIYTIGTEKNFCIFKILDSCRVMIYEQYAANSCICFRCSISKKNATSKVHCTLILSHSMYKRQLQKIPQTSFSHPGLHTETQPPCCILTIYKCAEFQNLLKTKTQSQ